MNRQRPPELRELIVTCDCGNKARVWTFGRDHGTEPNSDWGDRCSDQTADEITECMTFRLSRDQQNRLS